MRHAEQTFGWPLHPPSAKRSRSFSSWHGCEAGEPTKRGATHDSIVSRIESRQRLSLMLGSTRALNSVRNAENHQRCRVMAAVSGRELLLSRLGFSGSLLCVEGPDGQQQVAATQTSRLRSAPKSGARAISSASAVVLNVGRHRWMVCYI